jgi:dTDP-glucose 4,6-dehydratase
MNMPIMDPEQYLIADEMCVRETGRAQKDMGFVPQYNDMDMLIAAYDEYRGKIASASSQKLNAVPAE